MLDNMLGNVIPILILYKRNSANMKLLKQRSLCSLVTVFEHTLDDTAPIGMSRQSMNLAMESFDDELDMFCWYSLNSFLNHMVAILVFHTLEDMTVQFLNEGGLLLCQYMLESLWELSAGGYGRLLDSLYLPFEQPYSRTSAWKASTHVPPSV